LTEVQSSLVQTSPVGRMQQNELEGFDHSLVQISPVGRMQQNELEGFDQEVL